MFGFDRKQQQSENSQKMSWKEYERGEQEKGFEEGGDEDDGFVSEPRRRGRAVHNELKHVQSGRRLK